MHFASKHVPTFYQSKDFAFEHNRIVPRRLNRQNIVLGDNHPALRDYVMSYFDCTGFERTGVLNGDYILDDCGFGLLRRDGLVFKINVSWEDSWGSNTIDERYSSAAMCDIKERYIDDWERTPLVDTPLILSHPYMQNYFYFTMEVMTKLRFFSALRGRHVAIARSGVAQSFQVDLLQEMGDGRLFVPVQNRIRVRNPMLVDETMSEEGIYWLNQNAPFQITQGKRNIYVRRGRTGSRMGAGGDIAQTVDFQAFLKEHRFETVAFGAGDARNIRLRASGRQSGLNLTAA